jgi:hypothetical protein
VAWCARGAAETPTGYDLHRIEEHRQLFEVSCIPSAVEMVLKLTGHAPAGYFALQEAWKDKTDGTFADFDNHTIAGLTFRRQFSMPRGPAFPLRKLFAAINAELGRGRYVIVSLNNDVGGYHAWVVVQRLAGGEYRAVTKYGRDTTEITDTRLRIQNMQGTDIATYKIVP